MLLPFILLILMLLLNMGYNGIRHRMAQAALRLGAFEFVTALATNNRQKSADHAKSVANNQTMFPNESNAATFNFSSVQGFDNLPPELKQEIDDVKTDGGGGLLSNASSRETVVVTVTRDPPYADLVDRTPIRSALIISSNTWTYCEMKDKDQGVAGLKQLDDIGKYGLWLFGGCGGSAFNFKCEDKCPN